MMWILGLLAKAFPTIAAWLDSKEATRRALISANAQVGSEALRTAGVEAQAREETRRAYVLAGGWIAFMGIFPAFMIGSAVGFHIWAVVIDSVFSFDFVVHALPGAMADWEGEIAVGMVVAGGGIGALKMILGRR